MTYKKSVCGDVVEVRAAHPDRIACPVLLDVVEKLLLVHLSGRRGPGHQGH
jgi:hypothetical protein